MNIKELAEEYLSHATYLEFTYRELKVMVDTLVFPTTQPPINLSLQDYCTLNSILLRAFSCLIIHICLNLLFQYTNIHWLYSNFCFLTNGNV